MSFPDSGRTFLFVGSLSDIPNLFRNLTEFKQMLKQVQHDEHDSFWQQHAINHMNHPV
jgi:predicted CoA-binding protein